MAKESRNDKRVARHKRVRKNLSGTPEMPRLCVFRSNKNISAQIIDDVNGVTLVSASTLDKELKAQIEYGGNKEAARQVGEAVAKRALEKHFNFDPMQDTTNPANEQIEEKRIDAYEFFGIEK